MLIVLNPNDIGVKDRTKELVDYKIGWLQEYEWIVIEDN